MNNTDFNEQKHERLSLGPHPDQELAEKFWREHPLSKQIQREVDEVMNSPEMKKAEKDHQRLPFPREIQREAMELLAKEFTSLNNDLKKWKSDEELKNIIPKIHELKAVIENPHDRSMWGDNLVEVLTYVLKELEKRIQEVIDTKGSDAATEKYNNFKLYFFENLTTALNTVPGVMGDVPAPFEILTLQSIFDSLNIPRYPVDKIKDMSVEEYDKTFKDAFEKEKEDLRKEIEDNKVRTKNLFQYCEKEKLSSAAIETVGAEMQYWNSKIDAENLLKYKLQFRAWESMLAGKITPEEMQELSEIHAKNKRKLGEEESQRLAESLKEFRRKYPQK